MSVPEQPAADPPGQEPEPTVNDEPLSPEQLEAASSLSVRAPDGTAIPLSEVTKSQKPGQSVLLIALRHAQAAMDQAYVAHIASTVTAEALQAANARIVFLSLGEPRLLESYSKAAANPYPLLSAGKEVYEALGMTLRTRETIPNASPVPVQKHGVLKSITSVLGRFNWAIRDAGDTRQVGGEDGVNTFAHRQTAINDRVSVQMLAGAAGIPIAAAEPEPKVPPEVNVPTEPIEPEPLQHRPNVITAPLTALDETAILPTTRTAVVAQQAAEEAAALAQAEEAARKALEIASKVITTPTAKMMDTPIPDAVIRSVEQADAV